MHSMHVQVAHHGIDARRVDKARTQIGVTLAHTDTIIPRPGQYSLYKF